MLCQLVAYRYFLPHAYTRHVHVRYLGAMLTNYLTDDIKSSLILVCLGIDSSYSDFSLCFGVVVAKNHFTFIVYVKLPVPVWSARTPKSIRFAPWALKKPFSRTVVICCSLCTDITSTFTFLILSMNKRFTDWLIGYFIKLRICLQLCKASHVDHKITYCMFTLWQVSTSNRVTDRRYLCWWVLQPRKRLCANVWKLKWVERHR